MVALQSPFLLLLGLCLVASTSLAVTIPPHAEGAVHVQPRVNEHERPFKASASARPPAPVPPLNARGAAPAPKLPVPGAPQPPNLPVGKRAGLPIQGAPQLPKPPVGKRDLPVKGVPEPPVKGAPQPPKLPMGKRSKPPAAVEAVVPPHIPIGKRSSSNVDNQELPHASVKYTRAVGNILAVLGLSQPEQEDEVVNNPSGDNRQIVHGHEQQKSDDVVFNDPHTPRDDSKQFTHVHAEPKGSSVDVKNPSSGDKMIHKNVETKRNPSPDPHHGHHHDHHDLSTIHNHDHDHDHWDGHDHDHDHDHN